MMQKSKDGFVLFGAFLIYVFGMLIYLLVRWLFWWPKNENRLAP